MWWCFGKIRRRRLVSFRLAVRQVGLDLVNLRAGENEGRADRCAPLVVIALPAALALVWLPFWPERGPVIVPALAPVRGRCGLNFPGLCSSCAPTFPARGL